MIADAAGFSSVLEASQALSMTNAEAERAAKADAERKNQQELLNKAIERSIPIQEKLELLMANFGMFKSKFIQKLLYSLIVPEKTKSSSNSFKTSVLIASISGTMISGL